MGYNFIINLFRDRNANTIFITMSDLDIIVGLITTGFVTTSSYVPSLSVMSLKMKKLLGLG